MRILIPILLIGGYALVACGLYVLAFVIGQSLLATGITLALVILALTQPRVRAELGKLWKQIARNM